MFHTMSKYFGALALVSFRVADTTPRQSLTPRQVEVPANIAQFNRATLEVKNKGYTITIERI